MSETILDGTGTGKELKIDSAHRARIQGQTESEQVYAAKSGDAFNIHSGEIVLTSAGTAIYVKNNEDRDLVIQGMVVGLGQGTTSDNIEIFSYKDVTGGDIVTDATPADFQSNRNYGSAKKLSADAFKGKSGGTVAGDQVGLYYTVAGQRMFAEVNKVLPKGATICIYVDPKLTAGSIKMYCVLVTHLRDID